MSFCFTSLPDGYRRRTASVTLRLRAGRLGGRQFSTGIIVDRVQEVLDIAGSSIEETPQFGATVNTDFILGMGKVGDSVKILLDIDKVLGDGGLSEMALDNAAAEVSTDT